MSGFDGTQHPSDSDEVVWVDLGSLKIPADAGVDVQVQADQTTGAVSQVSLVIPGAAVQVQPYAAPRSAGLWSEIRQELMSSIVESGGQVREVSGPFGTELLAQVPSDKGSQSARFAAMEGPRWLLRLVFLGSACQSGPAASQLERVVRRLAVDRGDTAMPPRAPLPLQLPDQAFSADDGTGKESPSRSLRLPERGPEITEVR